MRTKNVDYPHKKYFSFSNDAWRFMRKAEKTTGNTMMFLVRKWCEAGARADIAEHNNTGNINEKT